MKEIFDLEESRLREEIIKRGAKRVLIQLPEGLRTKASIVASIIENAGALAIVSADPCYGACDLAIPEAESLSADLIVHFGHSELVKSEKVPVVYFEARAMIGVGKVVEEALHLLEPWKKVGLVTTIQHLNKLDEVRGMLNEAGKTVVVGDARRMTYPGQIIGCDYNNAESIKDEVEAFLFLGGGRFHPIGLAIDIMKPTIVADIYEGRAYSIDSEVQATIKKRWACISKAKESKNFGVLIGLKTGQKNIEAALRVKDLLVEKNKKATLLALREMNNTVLLQFPELEAFVNTSCPRVSFGEFQKPVLTIREALVMLGELEWENLLSGGWFGRSNAV